MTNAGVLSLIVKTVAPKTKAVLMKAPTTERARDPRHERAVRHGMTEREYAVGVANAVLDQPWADPDSDIAVLARQFLQALEREKNGHEKAYAEKAD